jgi:glycine cleavage system aminomethyltransferase T
MTDGFTHIDHARIDVARTYPFQQNEQYIHDRCYEGAFKIYNPPVHTREPYGSARGIYKSPFHEREKALGAYFMELSGWERAHGYASNEHLLAVYGDRVPVRGHEWDNRHFWRVSNAEHLKMSEDVGMINISHFAEFDVVGPDAADLLEYICVAKVGGDTPVGKGIYTHFLDAKGGVRADLTVLRLGQDHYRVIDGADAGHRDLTWVRRMAQDRGANVTVTDTTTQYGCLGVWGPNARATIQKIADEPEAWTHENFPFAALRELKIQGVPVLAFRISYVG